MIGLAILDDDDLVDEVLVEVGHLYARKLLKLLDGAHANHILGIVVADPDRNAAAPEAVARNVPVAGILQPVAETLFAHVFRRPVDGGVISAKTLVKILDLDIPGINSAIDKRRVGTVAERIRVDDGRLMYELALGLETLDDVLVAILAEAALVFGKRICKCTGIIERIDERRNARFLAHAEVVLAVSRSNMHETNTIISRHIIIVGDAEGPFRLLVGEIREDRFVLDALELIALKFGDELVLFFLLEDVGKTRLCHDIDGLSFVGHVAHGYIIDIGTSANHQVLGKRPRRCRPNEQIDCRLGGEQRLDGFALGGERTSANRHRRILHILVVAAGLKVRKRSRKLPAVRHDAVRLVNAPLVPKLLEDPPDGLHKLGIHRLVVVAEIDPAPHARNRLLPLVDIL